jgi:hypothetical protein
LFFFIRTSTHVTLFNKIKNQLHHFQNLQRTIGDSDKELRETRYNHTSIQSDSNRAQLRYEVSRLFFFSLM